MKEFHFEYKWSCYAELFCFDVEVYLKLTFFVQFDEIRVFIFGLYFLVKKIM